MGKDKESQGEFSHYPVLFSASRDISYILGRWLCQYWENFDGSAKCPCLTLTTTYKQLQMPGMQEECKAQFFLVHWEFRVPNEAVYEGEERGMNL
jgi:hypothetical protein